MSAFPSPGGESPRPVSAPPNLAKRSFLFSIALHAVFVLAAVAIGVFSARSRKTEPKDVMIEFTVAVPPQPEETAAPEPDPEPAAKPEPEPEAPPPKPKDPDALPPEKPKPPKFVKGKIVRREAPKPERRIVERPKKETPPKVVKLPAQKLEIKGPKLSDEEIRKLLDQGARPSDRTSVPDSENARCTALIFNAVKRAWICPDASAITGREPKIEFTLGTGGSLGNVRLVASSGNAEFDQSVVNAARAVRFVSGLTPGFIRENPRVTITFALEGA